MLPWQPHNIAPHCLTLVSSFSYLFLEIFLVLWFVSILKAFMMASIFKCQEQLMAWHLLRLARTIIWVVGVNFDQGKFELRGFYVFVHSTCWLQNIWNHIYDVFLEGRQRASRGVRCTALCRRSIFNRRWVCTRLIDQLEIALGTGSMLCQIAPWDCFRDECCPSFPRNLVIVNERSGTYPKSPTMQFDTTLTQSHSEAENG